MTRLFITLYSSLLLSFLVFILIADQINTHMIMDIENHLESEHLSAEIQLLEKLSPHLSAEEFSQELATIADKNQLIITPLPKQDVPIRVQQQLEKTYVWRDDDEYDYFRLFTPYEYFRTEENEEHPLLEIEEQVDVIIFGCLLLTIAITIILWFSGLHRKMRILERAVIRFSDGQLETRVTEKPGMAIGKLNQSFNQMAAQVQDLLNSHRQLTHYIAHELRTPLFKMQIQLELLESCVSDSGWKHINGLEEDIEALQSMVEELLRYAQMERAELKLKPSEFAVVPFCQKVLFNTPYKEGLIMSFNPPANPDLKITADRDLLTRALGNLLSNGVKYGHGEVTLSVITDHEGLHFEVADNGPGIGIEFQKNIFNAFQRLKDKQHNPLGGFGLGLAICQNIVHLHQGQVDVTNRPEGGARFTIHLPATC